MTRIHENIIDQASLGNIIVPSTNQPCFYAYSNSNQTGVAELTWTKVAFDLEEYDSHDWYDTSLYRYTPLKAGKYLFTTQFFIYPLPDYSYVYASNRKNGSGYFTSFYWISSASNTSGFAAVTTLLEMNGVDDYVEPCAYFSDYQNVGATATIYGSENRYAYFTGMRVSA